MTSDLRRTVCRMQFPKTGADNFEVTHDHEVTECILARLDALFFVADAEDAVPFDDSLRSEAPATVACLGITW